MPDPDLRPRVERARGDEDGHQEILVTIPACGPERAEDRQGRWGFGRLAGRRRRGLAPGGLVAVLTLQLLLRGIGGRGERVLPEPSGDLHLLVRPQQRSPLGRWTWALQRARGHDDSPCDQEHHHDAGPSKKRLAFRIIGHCRRLPRLPRIGDGLRGCTRRGRRVGRTPRSGARPTGLFAGSGGPRLDESRLDPPYPDPAAFSYTLSDWVEKRLANPCRRAPHPDGRSIDAIRAKLERGLCRPYRTVKASSDRSTKAILYQLN